MTINAKGMHFKLLNQQIKDANSPSVTIEHCNGQRYIGSGQKGKTITIYGTAGNALGSYLDGCDIIVHGNASEAVGDTMNDGTIVVHGNCGDACGYAMRGGKIFVQRNAGYRVGIHMKEYHEKKPIMVIGGSAGSFLGEYQAGGIIIVLGLPSADEVPVGNFCGTGMHGGKIYIRSKKLPLNLPKQVSAKKADEKDMQEISSFIQDFCSHFNEDYDTIVKADFYCLLPDTKNPFKQLYVNT